jgi:hypothetical protein
MIQIDLQENYQGIKKQEATRKNEESRRKNQGRINNRDQRLWQKKVSVHPIRQASCLLLLGS